MADIHQKIKKNTNSCSTDELWCIFRDGLQEGIRKFIPHKTVKSKDNFPWITADIRKMMWKQDKLYSRQKSSRTAEKISQFKSLKHRVQREVRSAYWSYVESIIEPMDEEKPYEGMKCFWTLMKHAPSDSGGIAPLRDQVNWCLTPVEKPKSSTANSSRSSRKTRQRHGTFHRLRVHSRQLQTSK